MRRTLCWALAATLSAALLPAIRAEAAVAPRFTDTFDGAVDDDPTYGLNDGLAGRQTSVQRGVTYTRVSGLWYPAPAPRRQYSQVNHVYRPGVLSFWLGHSAVRLDAPVVAGSDGLASVSAVLDPVTGDSASGQWASLMLTSDRDNSGYVTSTRGDVGVIVRSNGGVTVFHAGVAVGSLSASPDGGGRFAVTVIARPGENTARVIVQGVSTSIALSRAFPAAPTLFLGAYLDDSAATSTVDDLAVSAVDNAALLPRPGSAVRHFGYFGTRLGADTGNHLPEVAGRSTLNHLLISDYARYVPETLDACAPASCVVYAGFEFFTGCETKDSPACRLHDAYQTRWRNLAAAITAKPSRLHRVAAFYLLDEPYHRGAKAADLATAARLIKTTFPGTKVMLVEAGYKVPTMTVPDEVDWVGFDEYCEPVSYVEQLLNELEPKLAAHQQVFLFPQAAPLRACAGKAGYSTDADIARLQWDYLALAERRPRVGGLMTFGLWVEGAAAAQLPATVDAHERIMARIIAH
jgi:hypothetical protein